MSSCKDQIVIWRTTKLCSFVFLSWDTFDIERCLDADGWLNFLAGSRRTLDIDGQRSEVMPWKFFKVSVTIKWWDYQKARQRDRKDHTVRLGDTWKAMVVTITCTGGTRPQTPLITLLRKIWERKDFKAISICSWIQSSNSLDKWRTWKRSSELMDEVNGTSRMDTRRFSCPGSPPDLPVRTSLGQSCDAFNPTPDSGIMWLYSRCHHEEQSQYSKAIHTSQKAC